MPRESMSHGLKEKGQMAAPSAHQGSALVTSPDPWRVAPGPGVGLPMTLDFPLIKLKCFLLKKNWFWFYRKEGIEREGERKKEGEEGRGRRRERKEERQRLPCGRETCTSCLLQAPTPGIEPTTF